MIVVKQSKIISRTELLVWLQKSGEPLESIETIAAVTGFEWQGSPILEKERVTTFNFDEGFIQKKTKKHQYDDPLNNTEDDKINQNYQIDYQFEVVKHENHRIDENANLNLPTSIQDVDDFSSEDFEPITDNVPVLRPLVRWERLWPRLKDILSLDTEIGIDYSQAIRNIAQCKVLNGLPKKLFSKWSGKALLVMDFNSRVLPFWDDFLSLRDDLLKIRGRQGLEVEEFESYNRIMPAANRLILILSDIGMLSESQIERKHWLYLGRKLKSAGFLPYVLAPVSPQYIDLELSRYYYICLWDRNSRFLRQQHCENFNFVNVNSKIEKLITLLSPAIRIEPELLRDVRYLLSANEFDVSLESKFWQHIDIEVSPVACALKESKIEYYRQLFKEQPSDIQKAIIFLIRQHHAHLFPAIIHYETLIWASLVPDEVVYEMKDIVQEAKVFLQKTAKMLYKECNDLDDAKRSYGKRLLSYSHNDLLHQHLSLSVIEGVVNIDQIKHATQIRDGIDIQELQCTILNNKSRVYDCSLYYYNGGLYLVEKGQLCFGLFVKNFIYPINFLSFKLEMIDGKINKNICLVDFSDKPTLGMFLLLKSDWNSIKSITIYSQYESLLLNVSTYGYGAWKDYAFFSSDNSPTIAGKFIGRKKEIKMLNQAWRNKNKSIVQLIAPGGTGKTKLIRHWLNLIKPKNFITWFFHSQGENENTQTSSTLFFEHAFHRLQSQEKKFWSEEAKGEHLAELLRQHQCLLVLDGIEPLQYSINPKTGKLKDRAIRQLLKSISNNPECLCVITSRIAVDDISDYDTVNTYSLSNLSLFDSVTLLKSFLIKKVSKRDVENLCTSYNKHALTITLLGQLIKLHHNGDIRKFREPKKIIDESGNKNEYSAFKIMSSYEEYFKNQCELPLLYCLGLFDHPVNYDVLMHLCKSQIPELTLGINESAWARAIDNLQNNYYLITPCDYDHNQLDSQPLIREYFGDQLNTKHHAAWIKANETLYEYYRSTTLKHAPDDIKDIQPLIHAVKHGCLANLHQQAFDTVYYKRISRGKTYYLHKVGACMDDLAVLSSFLEKKWTVVHTGIKLSDQAFILRTIAHRLRSLGWIEQCIEPFNASLSIYKKLANKSKIAKTESDLIEPYLTLGYIDKAIELAESGVKKNYHIDPVLDRRLRRVSVYARALHQSGQYEEAVFYFREAEKIQKQYKPNIKYLMGLSGFRYCELLIENNQCEDALHHAREGLSLAEKQLPDDKPYTLFIGLNKLILGRAILKSGGGEEAAGFIKEALEDLRKANDQDHLPRGLLMCANLNCTIRDFEKAHQRLKEVLEIAKPNGMRLHIVDCYLEYVNLYLAEGKLAKAQEYLKNAKALIEETGYHRRDAELADLQAQLQALSLSTV